MSYSYLTERPWLFTDGGQRYLIALRDRVMYLLQTAGAVRMQEALHGVQQSSPGNWAQMAAMDRLVELGDLRELKYSEHVEVPGQYRVFVSAKVDR